MVKEYKLVPMAQPSIEKWKEIWKDRLNAAESEPTKELCRVALEELKKYDKEQEA